MILIISVVGFGLYHLEGSEIEITQSEQLLLDLLIEERTINTSNDEKKTLKFSNGSKIVLNSNSSLTYSIGFPTKRTINVTLRGEAWFDSESDRNGDQSSFVIATPDGIIKKI